VATSERVLTTPPNAGHVQPLQTAQTLAPSGQLVWLHALLDFVTVLVTLFASDLLLHAANPVGQVHQLASHPAVASMVVIMLAFAGAYPRIRTPLDIASTAGVVRAASCMAILVVIASVGWHGGLSPAALPFVICVPILLVVQRELTTSLIGRWPLRQSFAGSATSNWLVLTYPVGNQHESEENRAGYLLKRAIDLLGATILLILALPLGMAVAVLIKLDSKGPVLLRQKRIGRCGTPFYMWKFRSMYVGVPRYARSPVSDCDPRLTRVGGGLRRLSIDELPQLFNVLKGDMSLVGPRPEMPFIVKDYTAYERLRLNATPGITGLWQISPARAMPIHQNLELDLFYIEHRSFFLDTAIMLRTVIAVMRGIGAL
jgi:lipopolysaccharide/colanic/teichoic acid biosynthesis glycosyltransferase